MAYRNKTYVSFDADNDISYYYLMKAWKQNDNVPFNFYDAHDINNCYDKSEESIKASLEERFRNSKAFVLLVGEHTKNLYKYVRWEIEQAIKRELPIIVVNINGKRGCDEELCPAIARDALAVHISFNSKILQYALENWPDFFEEHKRDEKGPYRYGSNVYEKLGL
ncbi:MAG: TIR domain-containing protein [Spirochaetales bacterium]|nr:TIR domain-containing protein [Spirochaetales bacterium]